jgi:hypothetical protein
LSHSWNRFNRYHYCIYIFVYTIVGPYSPSYPLSLLPLHFHWYQQPSPPTPWAGPFLPFFLRFFRRKKMTFLLVWDKGSYTGIFLVIFPCIYVL